LKAWEQLVKFQLIAMSLTVLPLAVQAQAFDSDAYCQQVGAAAGGGAQLETDCREQERMARSNIDRMRVAPAVMDYCRQVGQSAGGSYRFMESCLREEAKTGDRLK
jgi:hypothetical protein